MTDEFNKKFVSITLLLETPKGQELVIAVIDEFKRSNSLSKTYQFAIDKANELDILGAFQLAAGFDFIQLCIYAIPILKFLNKKKFNI